MAISGAFSQVNINLTVPENTPVGDSIYIAGNFNNWNPKDPNYRLVLNSPYHFSITFTPSPGALEFKFTRGSWGNVEGTENGGFIPNRTFTYSGSEVALTLEVKGWEDNSAVHTATPQVHILSENFQIPQLQTERRVWIYLPAGYDTSHISYSVLYLQDGQNLFDRFYSFSGEWNVDESMDSLALIYGQNSIVVGIDNGGTERINEYSPWVNSTYGGGKGEKYTEFIVNTLKPYVDSHYRTLSDREHTGIGGSSMGALISIYAGLAYNDVFSKVGLLSPSFWFSDSLFAMAKSFDYKYPSKFYFLVGKQEPSSTEDNVLKMIESLQQRNVPAGNISSKLYDGAHNELFWSKYYPEMYHWLFGPSINKVNLIHWDSDTMAYPNPVTDKFKINFEVKKNQLLVFDINQKYIGNLKQQNDGSFQISHYESGMYILKGINSSSNKQFVIKILKL